MRIGVVPNESSFTSALNSCCGLEDIERGKVIHAAAVKMGLESGGYVGGVWHWDWAELCGFSL